MSAIKLPELILAQVANVTDLGMLRSVGPHRTWVIKTDTHHAVIEASALISSHLSSTNEGLSWVESARPASAWASKSTLKLIH